MGSLQGGEQSWGRYTNNFHPSEAKREWTTPERVQLPSYLPVLEWSRIAVPREGILSPIPSKERKILNDKYRNLEE